MTRGGLQVELATEPGDGSLPNEDAVLATADTVVVLDGVTPMNRADTGCVHGVAWFARTLGGLLVAAATGRDEALAACLAEAIEATRWAHGGRCAADHPDSPAATVAAVRARGAVVEHLVLADSAVVYDRTADGASGEGESGCQVMVDGRAAEVGRRLRAEGGSTTAAAVRSWRNRPGGYWVAAADPAAAAQAVTGTVPAADVGHIVLATDGATRPVEVFGSHTWAELVAEVGAHGPAAWLARTREAERRDPDRRRWRRAKVHDDATVALVRRR